MNVMQIKKGNKRWSYSFDEGVITTMKRRKRG
jgi:hypothetical protein